MQTGAKPELSHSWTAMLGQKREQLVSAVHHCNAFDSAQLLAFDKSRQADGRYAIDAGDSILMNNAKALINIFSSIEQAAPSFFNPLAEYINAEGRWRSGIKMAGLTYSAGMGISKIKTLFVEDLWYLRHYFAQFKKVLAGLPAIDDSFMPLLADLKKALEGSIEPILTNIKFLQGKTAKELGQEKNEMDEVLQALQTVLSATSVEGELQRKPKGEEESSVFLRICGNINSINIKLNNLISQQDESAKPDSQTGLYSDYTAKNENILNLMHAVNAMQRFKTALEKVDRTFNHREIHFLDTLRDLGHALKELQRVKIDKVKRLGAEGLLHIIEAALKELEPIFVELSCLLEVSENRLGIKDQALQNQFNEIAEAYEKLAAGLGVELKHKAPYWKERLQIRRQELQRKQEEVKHLKNVREVVAKADLNENAPLRQFLRVQKEAKKINSPKIWYYDNAINLQVDERTGMSSLNKFIAYHEDLVRASKAKDAKLVAELKKLYELRETLIEELERFLQEGESTEVVFYNHNSGKIERGQEPAMVSAAPDPSQYKEQALSAIDELLSGVKRDDAKMSALIDMAEENILTDNKVYEVTDSSNFLFVLKGKIEACHPEMLFKGSLSDLQQLQAEIKELKRPQETELYERMLSEVIKRRSSFEFLQKQKEVLRAKQINIQKDIQILNKYKDLSLQDDPHLYEEEMIKRISVKLGVAKDEIDRLLALPKSSRLARVTSYFRGAPFHNLITQRLANLHHSHSELAREMAVIEEAQNQGSYHGEYLEVWEEAKGRALRVVRKGLMKGLGQGPRKVESEITTVEINEIVEESELPTETPEVLLARLVDEKRGSLLVMIHSAKASLLKWADAGYLDPEELAVFKNETARKDGTYLISNKDSLLVKNLKSSLNMFTRFSVLVGLVQNQINSLYYNPGTATYLGLFPGVREIKQASQALQAELADFQHHFGQLKSIYRFSSNFPILPVLSEITGTVSDSFNAFNNWISMPGISSFMGGELIGKLNASLLSLNTMAASTEEEMRVGVEGTDQQKLFFGQIEEAKVLLDSYIHKKGITKDGKLYHTKDAGNDADLKNLLLFANALVHFQNNLQATVNVADQKRMRGSFKFLKSLWKLSKLANRFDSTRIKDLELSFKLLFKAAHFFLIQRSIGAPLVEKQLGLAPGLLNQQMAKLCVQVENSAKTVGVSIETHYPYVEEKLALYQQELEYKRQKLEKLAYADQLILRMMESASPLSLNDLFNLQKILEMLPPSKTVEFKKILDTLLAENTGISDLDQKAIEARASLESLEERMLKEEEKLSSLLVEMRQVELQRLVLGEIQDDFSQGVPLSMEKIKFLHSLYPNGAKLTLQEFCTLLVTNRDPIQNFAEKELAQVQCRLTQIPKQEAEHHKLIKQQMELHEQLKSQLVIFKNQKVFLHNNYVEANQLINNKVILSEKNVLKNVVNSLNTVVKMKSPSGADKAKAALLELTKGLREEEEWLISEIEVQRTKQKGFFDVLIVDSRARLYGLEKVLGLVVGSLAVVLSLSSKDKRPNLQQVYATNSLPGLFRAVLEWSPDRKAAARYTFLLSSLSNPKELALAVAKVAASNTWAIARWFRKWSGTSSLDDKIYYLANHFAEDAHYKEHFERQGSKKAVATQEAFSLSDKQPANPDHPLAKKKGGKKRLMQPLPHSKTAALHLFPRVAAPEEGKAAESQQQKPLKGA